MSTEILLLLGALTIWTVLCGWCGFRARFVWFAVVLLCGLALNAVWIMVGLSAGVFSVYAVMAHAAALMYALSTFGTGWIIGRFVRQWKASRVNAP